jgi:DNA end-binding protein Ku
MNFADEVHATTGLRELASIEAEPDAHELDVARRLVASVAEPFDIEQYEDAFREAVLDLIDRKAAGEPLQLGEGPGQAPETPDVGMALEASLASVSLGSGH